MPKRNNLKVIWSSFALRDVHDLGDYLVEFMSVAKAELIVDSVLCAGDSLGEFPHMSRLRNDIHRGLRLVTVRPYVICYLVQNKSVRIVRVLHGKQDSAAALSANHMSPLL